MGFSWVLDRLLMGFGWVFHGRNTGVLGCGTASKVPGRAVANALLMSPICVFAGVFGCFCVWRSAGRARRTVCARPARGQNVAFQVLQTLGNAQPCTGRAEERLRRRLPSGLPWGILSAMDVNKRFSFRSLDELTAALAERGHALPVSDDMSVLGRSASFGRLVVPNRLVCQPMEGCDGEPDGSPGRADGPQVPQARRRRGGDDLVRGLCDRARGQGESASDFAAQRHRRGLRRHGAANQAGREGYRRLRARLRAPDDPLRAVQQARRQPAPIIAHHSAVLDGRHNLPPDYPLITDERLDELQDAYVAQAVLAAEAGFDAVDVKACHRYLLNELLASFTREGSRYGGSYENRTRMLRETIARVRKAVGASIEVTSRMNAYDAIAYPYGWGVSAERREPAGPDRADPPDRRAARPPASAGSTSRSAIRTSTRTSTARPTG